MKYKKYTMEGYDLYLLNTDRFKTIEYKINIRIKNEKENDIYLPLLRRLLISTSSKYKTVKEINEACASIYDPYYSLNTIKSGSENIISQTGTFTNEKYTEKGMNEENIKFLSHFLFNPKIKDEQFDDEVFEIKKSKLIENYILIKDHPRDYADFRLEEELDYLNYKNYSLENIIQQLKKLTNKKLYKFYKKIMQNGKLDIFVCGNFSQEKMKNIIQKHIKFKGIRNDKINHIITQNKYNKPYNVIVETSPNVQSNLVIGCKVNKMNKHERKYVFSVYSWILGGGMNSLLNQKVREENSLCYYIYTSRKNTTSIMKIYAGIDAENFDKTLKLIESQMKEIERGNFPLKLLEGVKNIYKSSLMNIEDYQGDMVDSFISEVYIENDDIETRRKMIDRVNIDDVKSFAKKVHIDTVYLLKGDKK